MKSFIAITIFVFFGAANAGWRSCHRNSGGLGHGELPRSFAITGTSGECTETGPDCQIIRGQAIAATAQFVANNDIASGHLFPWITAHALGQVVHYELPDDIRQGCDHVTSTRCPISAGTLVSYTFDFFVSDEYPDINLNIEMRLFSGPNNQEHLNVNNRLQFCVDVSARTI